MSFDFDSSRLVTPAAAILSRTTSGFGSSAGNHKHTPNSSLLVSKVMSESLLGVEPSWIISHEISKEFGSCRLYPITSKLPKVVSCLSDPLVNRDNVVSNSGGKRKTI